jgi:hypothetical protein
MKPITPSLPFLSFPTDEVLRTFWPVRALLVETNPPAGAAKPHPPMGKGRTSSRRPRTS